jgi:hypothetical protein
MTIIIGIDPHKATHTAVAIDETEQPLAQFQLAADRCQAMRLLAWAAPFEDRAWAVESADGLGKLLSLGSRPCTTQNRSSCWPAATTTSSRPPSTSPAPSSRRTPTPKGRDQRACRRTRLSRTAPA